MKSNLLLAACAVALSVAACSSLAPLPPTPLLPSAAPVTRTVVPIGSPAADATMAPFSATRPSIYDNEDWTMAASANMADEPFSVSPYGIVKAGSAIDVIYDCSTPTTITFKAVADDGVLLVSGSGECRPGSVNADFAGPIVERQTGVNLATSSSNPDAKYWVKVMVPQSDLIPRN